MLNIFTLFKNELQKNIHLIAKEKNISLNTKNSENFVVEPCKNEEHGDIATNIAMILAKDFKTSPHNLASLIIKKLQYMEGIKQISIAGPGFININLNHNILYNFLNNILQNEEITLPQIGIGENINIEYASPNPTGPMHIGHCRGAIYGDILAKLLSKTNHKITKEYYINDAGNQIHTLVRSVYIRYLQLSGHKIELDEDLYPGEYLIDVAKRIRKEFSDTLLNKTESYYFNLMRDIVMEEMLNLILSDLKKINIQHDVLFSEKSELHDTNKIDQAINILDKKGLIYKGKIEAPKGEKSNNISCEEQLLFKSTLFGDDMDRVVKKSNGIPTYFAADIAYCLNKFERGSTKMILPLGYDHAGYVKRLTAITKAITDDKAEIKIILCQMVKFLKNGEIMKMSKRSGSFISAKEVINEVGSDVLRFMMMSRKNDIEIEFDLKKAIEQSKNNPIFYIQYAHTRCYSVIRNLKTEIPELANIHQQKIDQNLLQYLTSSSEISLIKTLSTYPRIIEMSVINYEPHRIAFYLLDIAGKIHQLWNMGLSNPENRFIIKSDKNLTIARVYLLLASAKIIASALDIFGIEAKKEMK